MANRTPIRIASLGLIRQMRDAQKTFFDRKLPQARRARARDAMARAERQVDAMLRRLPDSGPAEELLYLEPVELELLESLRRNQIAWRNGDHKLTGRCIHDERQTDKLLERLLGPAPSLFDMDPREADLTASAPAPWWAGVD